MTQLKQPPYQARVVQQQTGMITERWHEWLSLIRRYNRAELITGTVDVPVFVEDGTHQSVTWPLPGAEQGQVALASLDDDSPSGILLTVHTALNSVTVTIQNESGSIYAPGTITIRATAWRH